MELDWTPSSVKISQTRIIDKLLHNMSDELANGKEYNTPAIPGLGINQPLEYEKLMSPERQMKFRSCIGSLLYIKVLQT